MQTIRERVATLPERRALTLAVLKPIQRGKRDRTIMSAFNRLKPGSDGRIHTGLSVATTSMRLASSGTLVEESSTNLQNQINKIAALDPLYNTRDVMRADDGFRLVCRDYAGAEALCVFAYSQDWEWVDRILAGESIHALHAKEFFNLSCHWSEVKKKHPEVYTTSKNIGFLSFYSGSARTATVTFNKDYPIHGQRITEKETLRLQKILFQLHPLHSWWESVKQDLRNNDGIVTNCVEVSTPVLCADAVWRPIWRLNVGDKLLAFDEHRHLGSRSREMRIATVLALRERKIDCLRVVTEHGEVVATPNHLFLTKKKGGGGARWQRADKLRLGAKAPSRLYRLVEPWDSPKLPTWLGGIFDGEGSGRFGKHRLELMMAQNHGVVEQAIESALQAGGYSYTGSDRPPAKPNHKWARLWYIRGGFWELMRFLGTERPTRTETLLGEVDGTSITGIPSQVLAVEPTRKRMIVEIATTTGTLITDGFASHNCFGYQRPLRDPDEHNRLKDALSQLPQSTVAWLMNKALIDVHDNLDRVEEIELLHQNHDELDVQCLPECLDETLDYTQQAMEVKFKIHGRTLYIPTDASVSKINGSWANVKKV